MHALDRSLALCRALVVDPNPTSRSILASQLRDLGVGTVAQCSRAQDARRQLESKEFEFVLCEQDFPAESQTGQDLLDDLRRSQLLPFSTVFVMITAEASYDKVAEAAESALDGYLLKPHTAAMLAERLRQARQRKRVLREIFEAIEDGQFEVAARLCLQRFHDRGAFWIYAARIGAELLLRLEQHDAAQKLYEAVIAAQALPWARLGVARARLEAGQTTPARRTLESLIAQDPSYADAYDVMGRVQVEQGQLAEALETYRQASELTPGSLMRLQKRGMLAFYMGEHDEAAKALERACSVGISSKMFDYQSLVMLAFARFHQRDTKGLQRCVDNLQHALERAPQSKRLARFTQIATVLSLMLARQVGAVVGEVRQLATTVRETDIDVEAACNLLALLAELTAAELRLDSSDDWVDTLALRFASSRSLTELLARAAGSHPPFSERVRARHADLQAVAEQAMAFTLQGDPASTVRELLAHGDRTGNAKLIETAALTLQRHQHKIPIAAQLQQQVGALRQRYGTQQAVVPFVQEGARQSGGIALRVKGPADTDQQDEASTAEGTAASGDRPPSA